MAFDYNSRTKWEKERLERWNKEHERQIRKLTPEEKALFEEIGNFSDYPHCGFPVIRKWGRENVRGSGQSLKEAILSKCGKLADLFVPAQ